MGTGLRQETQPPRPEWGCSLLLPAKTDSPRPRQMWLKG